MSVWAHACRPCNPALSGPIFVSAAAVAEMPASAHMTHGAERLGAGLLVGSATGYLALSKKNTMDDDCETQGGRRVCGPDGLDAADTGKTFATVSTIAFAAGAAALGVGAYVLVTTPPEAERPNGAVLGFRGAF